MMKQVRVKQSLSYLEAMVGVLGAALGHAQIREADLVEDHRLRRQGKRRRQDKTSLAYGSKQWRHFLCGR